MKCWMNRNPYPPKHYLASDFSSLEHIPGIPYSNTHTKHTAKSSSNRLMINLNKRGNSSISLFNSQLYRLSENKSESQKQKIT